jgi:hypothetical protein
MMAVSTGMNVMSGMAAAKGNAKVAEINARNLEAAAEDARLRGGYEAGKKRLEGRQLVGEQRAIQGASGVRVGTGSTAEVVYGSAGMIEMDALVIMENAEREAQSLETEAYGVRLQSKYDQQAAKFGALGSIMGGAADIWGTKSP